MGLGSSVAVLPKCEPKLTKKSLLVTSASSLSNSIETVKQGETMTNGTLFQPQYTEVFSSAMVTGTLPIGSSGFVEYNTAHSNNWQSMEAPAVQETHRQSRSRHRHLIDSRHHNSFADSEAAVTAADTCISDIRRVEENLRMESRMLSENNNIPMARCSTPSPAYCFHCDHAHRERCCLYIGDTPEDGPYYSRWKRDLENPSVRPQYIPKIPEAVSGNSTPFWFPAYTYTKPEAIKQKMLEKHPPPPAVWMRQFYYPIVGYGHEYQLMNQATVEPPTPYQQYLQQHQQELYRMYQNQQQQQHQAHIQHSACRHGHKCDPASPVSLAAPQYITQPQYLPNPNLHAPQVTTGEYMQHVHHPSTYYYQTNVYNAPNQHHPHLPQQHYVPPVGYTSVPVYHEAYLHPAHYPLSYPPREPTPPSATTSTPLWLLFCQKLSRKFPDRSKKSSPTKTRSPGKNYPHHQNLRHNPVVTTVAPTIVPDYLPPKYATIDQHPQMQYQGVPAQSYTRPIGTTYYNHLPHPSAQPAAVAAPMNDIGMYYVTPATSG